MERPLTLTRRADRRLPSAADRRAPGIAGKIAEASFDRHSVGVPREQASTWRRHLSFILPRAGAFNTSHVIPSAVCSSRRGESETMIAAEGGSEQFEDGGFALLPRHTKVRASPDRGESEGDHRSEDASVSPSSRAERAGLILCLSVPRVSSRARATRVATPHPRGQSASIESYRKSTRLAAPRICSRPPRGRPPSNLPRDGSTRTTRTARPKTFGGWADLKKPSSK